MIDGKQMIDTDQDIADRAVFMSVFFDEVRGEWGLSDGHLSVLTPLKVRDYGNTVWGLECVVKDLTNDKTLDPEDSETVRLAAQFREDISVVTQCCHALRAGARLEPHTESSMSERRYFEKRGAGGFVYHILRLPAHARPSADGSGSGNGTHESPRLHVRRAHIRKLQTGTLTFVRQCLVGDPSKGIADKHYEVQP